jgi:nucleoside phosphorylase
LPRIGVISGLLEEADSVRPGSGRVLGDCPFYVREDADMLVCCAGMGKVNAAIGATFLIRRGCEILFSVGVAGRIGSDTAPVYWIDGSLQHDYGS